MKFTRIGVTNCPKPRAAKVTPIARFLETENEERTEIDSAGFNRPIPIPHRIEYVNISCVSETTKTLETSPIVSKQLPIMTKCFADKSFIRNPVARIVKFDRTVNIIVAKLIALKSDDVMIG